MLPIHEAVHGSQSDSEAPSRRALTLRSCGAWCVCWGVLVGLVFLLAPSARVFSADYIFEVPPPSVEQKRVPKYVLVYREWEKACGGTGFIIGDEHYCWLYRVRTFDRIADALETMTGDGTWNYINDDELIGLYQIGQEITLEYYEEKRVEPERVEIQEKKWTERWWEVKQ